MIDDLEAARLAALSEVRIVDTGPERDFDDIVALAAQLTASESAALTFVGSEFVWCKAAHNADTGALPRVYTLVDHVITAPGTVVVFADTQADPRAAATLAAMPDLPRFFAGVAVVSAEGHALGVLSVMASAPRSLTTAQRTSLFRLARQVVRLLDLRRASRAEEALEAAEMRFRSFTESSLDAIVTADVTGNVVGWNPAAARTFGYAREEILGQPLTLILPDRATITSRGTVASFDLVVVKRAAASMREVVGRRKDGSDVPLELTTSTWTTAEGRFFGSIIRDITDRKLAERALLDDLERRKTTEEELRRARDEAETAAHAKSDFLATMSHEIRTPLNGILGTAQLLLDTELRPDQRDHADAIRASSEALFSIVNDVLDFSKLEAGRLEIEKLPFSPRELIADTTLLFAQQAHAKGLEIVGHIDRDMPEQCLGDQSRVRQVLMNLIGNAVKFTHRGEIVVEARYEPRASGSTLRVQVRDSGIGMTEQARGRLFQPFSQADTSTTRKYGGTGLGLAITKRLLSAMGGSISVESSPHVGTTFEFLLPVGTVDTPRPSMRALAGLSAACLLGHDSVRRALSEDLVTLGMLVVPPNTNVRRQVDVLFTDEDTPVDDVNRAVEAWGKHQEKPVAVVRLCRFMATPAKEPDMQDRRSRVLRRPWRRSVLRETLIGGLGMTPTRELQMPAFVRRKEALGRGVRVLLVEDHPINQRVALGMLAKLGCEVTVAENGLRAIEAFAKSSFDLVLMDCYMPEMDGFAATRAIRESEHLKAPTMIVAMTASALAGDRERCLAAGMDEYLTKPLRLDALENVVDAAATTQAERLLRPHATPASGVEVGIAVLDHERVELLSQDADEWAELVGLYRSSASEAVTAMRTAVAQQDPRGLQQQAHKLKGTSANLGFLSVASLCSAIERMGSEGQVAVDPDVWDRLAHAVKRTLDEVAP